MTPERKYSVSEIDKMRQLVYWLTPWGMFSKPMGEHEKLIEDRLRTHMQNGTSIEELEAAVKEKNEREHRETLERERREGITITTSSDGKQRRNVKPGDPLWNKHRPWDQHPVVEVTVDSASWTGR